MDDAQFMSEFGRNPDADMMDSVRGMAVLVRLWICKGRLPLYIH